MNPNILFFNEYEVSPNFGGIERVTSGLSSALMGHDYKIHSAYISPISEVYPKANFSNRIQVDLNNIHDFIEYIIAYEIDIIILQNTFQRLDYVLLAIKESKRQIKLIFAHHMLPESEYSFLRFNQYKQTLFNNRINYFRDVIRLTKWSVNYIIIKNRWRNIYKKVYDKCDAIVLLDKEYINGWKAFANLKSINKFFVIPNPRTFDYSFEIKDYEQYKLGSNNIYDGNIVLVGRLEEGPKRISIALEIFNDLQKQYPNWHLYIVGDGPDFQSYKNYVKDNNFKNIHFEGLQNPQKYYIKGSIFMMTSEYEAFPLTLLEAQQMGCVPIAFDTFGSVSSIIKNRETGYIIPRGDKAKYIDHMKELIENPELRKNMANNAIIHSENFTWDKILDLWFDLLKK